MAVIDVHASRIGPYGQIHFNPPTRCLCFYFHGECMKSSSLLNQTRHVNVIRIKICSTQTRFINGSMNVNLMKVIKFSIGFDMVVIVAGVWNTSDFGSKRVFGRYRTRKYREGLEIGLHCRREAMEEY